MVFVDERQTTNFLPTKTVPHSTGVWFSIPRPRKIFHELAQNSPLMKMLPPEKYPLYGSLTGLNKVNVTEPDTRAASIGHAQPGHMWLQSHCSVGWSLDRASGTVNASYHPPTPTCTGLTSGNLSINRDVTSRHRHKRGTQGHACPPQRCVPRGVSPYLPATALEPRSHDPMGPVT